eukprot:TRINITY_DN2699_c0_g2_i1.p1 TRINITY_DN2699_c0_g2~~TRINITY_DN2699_c0_g2_i1.p1  ORF type:complete len:302 (+),score=57.37 TRINITY_DN2699_c0_g2_i1:68-973(+)
MSEGNEFVKPKQVLSYKFPESDFSYTTRDVILYALGLGACAENVTDDKELRYVYENHGDFAPLPTFGVCFPFGVMSGLMSVPGLTFNPMMLLHGEQYLEIYGPIPTSGTLTTSGRIKNIYDKGKSGLLVLEAVTRDSSTGKTICKNEMSLFIRGIGGFGGEKGPSSEPDTTPPKRDSDATSRQKTNENQAVLYRLGSGDLNPLHIDPQMAAIGGFDRPILHGLCSFGIAGRAILDKFCDGDATKLKSIRGRFAKHVFPGETLVTEMWKVQNKVIFRVKVEERGEYCITNAVAEVVTGKASL